MADKPTPAQERAYKMAGDALNDCKNLGRSRLPLVGAPKFYVDTCNQHIDAGKAKGNAFQNAYERGWAENT